MGLPSIWLLRQRPNLRSSAVAAYSMSVPLIQPPIMNFHYPGTEKIVMKQLHPVSKTRIFPHYLYYICRTVTSYRAYLGIMMLGNLFRKVW